VKGSKNKMKKQKKRSLKEEFGRLTEKIRQGVCYLVLRRKKPKAKKEKEEGFCLRELSRIKVVKEKKESRKERGRTEESQGHAKLRGGSMRIAWAGFLHQLIQDAPRKKQKLIWGSSERKGRCQSQ